MNLFDGPDLLETTSTEVKNRILKPGQMLRAIDSGALYYGDKDGKPTAFVGASTSSSGGVGKILAAIPFSVSTVGVPFIVPPGDGGSNGLSFTGGGGGAFTLSAPLLTGAGALLANCYLYLPANAAGSGCAAGWYYSRFTSDSAGTIYGNTYSDGLPTIPGSPAVFPGSPSGRITTPTAEIVGPSVGKVIGGALGNNGTLRWIASLLGDTSAVKQFRLKLGGATAMMMQVGATPLADLEQQLQNQGSPNKQRVTRNASTIGGQIASLQANSLSLDTSQTLEISASLQVTTNTGCAILLGYDVTAKYGD